MDVLTATSRSYGSQTHIVFAKMEKAQLIKPNTPASINDGKWPSYTQIIYT